MKFLINILTGALILFAGCAGPQKDGIFQTSIIDALLAGVYDGEMSCGDLLKHGDFGIGTFDALDGEMVVFDGTVYQVKADGKVYKPEPSVKTPFATVCFFKPENCFPVDAGANYKQLEALIDKAAPNRNLFVAVRVEGRFKSMRTRSVPRQKKPYPPLKEVTADQPEFDLANTTGTIVGFRCPVFVGGVNVPGYHLHFVDSGREKGGHILSFEVAEAECSIAILGKYFLVLPEGSDDFAGTDLSKNRASELKQVETGRARQ